MTINGKDCDRVWTEQDRRDAVAFAAKERAPLLTKPLKAAVRDELTRQEPPQFTPLGWPF